MLYRLRHILVLFGYLRKLEDVYELGYGIHATPLASDSPIRRADGSVQPSGVEELYKRVEQLVAMPSEERRATFQSRRQKMLSEKIDCAKFLSLEGTIIVLLIL